MKKKNNHSLILTIFLILFCVGLSCPPNCLSCLKENKCLTCQQDFYLTVNSQCVSKSVENCQLYSQTGKCTTCAATFIIDNKSNQCIKDYSGCLKRNQKGVCIQCGFGTTLNIKGECLGVINCAKPQKNCQSCLKGYNLASNKCVYAGSQCQVIHSSGLCQQCKDGYLLNGYECLSKASNSVQSGNANLIEKCNLYSRNQNTCLACENGYKLFNNACTSQGQIYNSTMTLADSKIRQASKNVYIDSSSEFIVYSKVLYSLSSSTKDDVLDPKQREISSLTFQGVGTTPSSIDNCLVRDPTTLACKVCIDGYYYFNGLCKEKSVVCSKFNTTTNKCEKCGDNFVLLNGECLDAGCEEYLYAQCAKCKIGFQINDEGYCYDPYCGNKTNGVCSKCLSGYELDQSSQLCYKIIIGCQLYNQQKNLCQKCNDGYDISPNGLCQRAEDERCLIYSKTNFQQCIRCRDQFALMQGTCIDLYCKVFQTPRKCNLCKQGYILHPTKYYCFDQNCVLYSNGTCINCANNHKLQEGFCVNVLVGCKKVEPATQKCSSCVDPYRIADGKCMYADNERCKNFSNNLCIQCKDNFALINGTCVDLLCENETLLNNIYTCTKCRPGYNLTSQGSCYDENCYVSFNGSCTRCADDYVIGQNGQCVKSTLGCSNWSQTENKCQSCIQGYNLNKNGVCTITGSTNNTNQTTTPTNPSNNSNIIIVNPSQNDNGSILTPGNNTKPDIYCKQFGKDSPTCIKCIQGRYFLRNSKCQPVPDICKGFDMKSGNCTSCQTTYAVYSQKSPYQDCIKKLQVSDPNCLLKNLNLFCIKCRPQYFIKGGFCYQADTQCKSFDLYGGDCLTCYDGFTLQNSKCIPLTKQSKCKQYNFQNVCIQCDKGYYVALGGICKQISSTCLSYEMIGGNCLSCSVGYWPLNGVCVKVRDPTPNCKNTNQLGNCVECVNRYYLQSVSLTCKSVNQLCNQYNVSTGACLSCNSGFKLRSDLGLCVALSSDDLCLIFNEATGICTKCQPDYILATSSSKCIKQVTLCSIYNQQTGECQKCQQPYVLSFKECIQKIKRDTLDVNCLLGDTYNFCIKCKTGYYISTGYCFKANTLCKTFNIYTGSCESCYDGFGVQNKLCADLSSANNNSNTIPSDDNCLSKSGTLCLKCKDRYFLSYDSQLPTCKKVSDACLTYNDINGYCFTCITGYTLSTSGNCIGSASNSTTSQNTTYIDIPQIFCKQYDLVMKICHKCYNSYYYSVTEGACKSLNLSCKAAEPATGHCTSCHDGCMLNATKCVPSAQTIKYYEDILSYQNAAQLNGDPNCVAISDSKCIQCQAGYYVSNATNKCDVLSQWCDTYEMMGGKCNKCKLGAIMQSGLCVKPVLGIDPNCSKYDGAYCVACSDGYGLNNYFCRKNN